MATTSTTTAAADMNAIWDAVPKVWQEGSCHCGAVKFKVLHQPLEAGPTCHIPVGACNCSICLKNGYLLIYPERHEIKWLSGWDEMKNYRFATQTRDHKFCGGCGSSVCIDFLGNWSVGDVLGVNVRLLHGVDILKLNLRRRNGRGFRPEFNDQYP
ncbi:Mss4-like protein [Cercophora scortea]|uniref:Mss4-like protein n=1 Tax=Cercophora scortea TaxID=314031 RepID=A0AAE0IXA9_9PEZI|nr:Mss4-like protein [Cercophora scortea]